MPEHLNRQQRRWEGLKLSSRVAASFCVSKHKKWHVHAILNTHLRGRCDGCQILAYGLHDPLTPHPQSDSDANTPIKQKVQRRLWLLVHRSFGIYQPYCYHWTNSIAGTSSQHYCSQYHYYYHFWLLSLHVSLYLVTSQLKSLLANQKLSTSTKTNKNKGETRPKTGVKQGRRQDQTKAQDRTKTRPKTALKQGQRQDQNKAQDSTKTRPKTGPNQSPRQDQNKAQDSTKTRPKTGPTQGPRQDQNKDQDSTKTGPKTAPT